MPFDYIGRLQSSGVRLEYDSTHGEMKYSIVRIEFISYYRTQSCLVSD